VIFAALVLAQLMTPPPPPQPFPTPVSVSEREIFDRGLRDAQRAAQSLGGLLGASIEDLNTGVGANTDGDQPFVLAGMEQLPRSILASNPQAHLEGIDLEPDGAGFASSNAFAHLLKSLYSDSLLPPDQTARVLQSLDTNAFGRRLRAGLPSRAQLEHVAGTIASADVAQATNDGGIVRIPGHVLVVVAMLHDAGGTEAQREAILAQVARAAVAGATALP
jgi:beta-lactamase class A